MHIVTHDGRQWSNAADDRVELVAFDSSWASQFETEARALSAVVPAVDGLRLEHFGSTAIPDLSAKPIIDVMVIHPQPGLWPALVEPITSLGYVYWSENPRKDQMFFVKGMPPFGLRRTHHVHVRVPQDAQAQLAFRDRLLAEPALARRYATLKESLAARYPNDRDAYTAGKAAFVAEVLGRNLLQGPSDAGPSGCSGVPGGRRG